MSRAKQRSRIERARARYFRRLALWHSAYLAAPTYETFRENIGSIERAIAAQIEREFEAYS